MRERAHCRTLRDDRCKRGNRAATANRKRLRCPFLAAGHPSSVSIRDARYKREERRRLARSRLVQLERTLPGHLPRELVLVSEAHVRQNAFQVG